MRTMPSACQFRSRASLSRSQWGEGICQETAAEKELRTSKSDGPRSAATLMALKLVVRIVPLGIIRVGIGGLCEGVGSEGLKTARHAALKLELQCVVVGPIGVVGVRYRSPRAI